METTQTHHEQSRPSLIGKLIIFFVIAAGFWILRTGLNDHSVPLPAWAVMLILGVTGILIGGCSNLVAEEKGGRAATYVGFVMAAIALLLMFDGWIFHAAGK